MIFLRIFIYFTSMPLNVHVNFAVYPLESFILLQGGPFPDLQSKGGGVWPDSGEEARRRRGASGGGARGG